MGLLNRNKSKSAEVEMKIAETPIEKVMKKNSFIPAGKKRVQFNCKIELYNKFTAFSKKERGHNIDWTIEQLMEKYLSGEIVLVKVTAQTQPVPPIKPEETK